MRSSSLVKFALGVLTVAQGTAPVSLGEVSFVLTTVSDSASYFVYEYDLTNPSTSDWAVGSIEVSIAASSGTPDNLAATGDLFDITTGGGAPVEPHAEVGPIAPAGWTAILDRIAGLTWAPPNSRRTTVDSVPPGATKSGFGIRSSYLPGLVPATAEPTITSCCLTPADTTEEPYYPLASNFAVSTTAVVPKYMPPEVTISLLQSQLATVCTDPLWLDDSALCTEFGDLLDSAESDENDSNFYGAAAVLTHLDGRVDDEQASMDSNAYWLLSLNVAQARDNVLASATAAADQWHFRVDANTAVVPDRHTLSGSPPASGSVFGTVAPSSQETFYFVKPVASAAAFVDGVWSLQLELYGFTANDSGLTLSDIAVHRYSLAGELHETKYLHQGDLASVPAGASRVSLAETLTGWSAGAPEDWLVLTVTLKNEGATGSENYNIRAGTTVAGWGASWLAQPK